MRNNFLHEIETLDQTERIAGLKERMFKGPRYLSVEQAVIITESYKKNLNEPRIIQRARALADSLRAVRITIDPEELIVGNRTEGVRAGVVFPEAGISWLEREIDTLDSRPQDPFHVRKEDARVFREQIVPFWKGKTLEEAVDSAAGPTIEAIEKVVKINQTDHAQGHICPSVETWLTLGPVGIRDRAEGKLHSLATDGGGTKSHDIEKAHFYRAVMEVMDGASYFMMRYAEEAGRLNRMNSGVSVGGDRNLADIETVCRNCASRPPRTFREAVQSVWFLFVILQMESNASSFSPGRLDQYLYSYFKRDIRGSESKLSSAEALELIEAFFLKFNQIVYMRSSSSARYFAGFPIGFNIAIGGRTIEGDDASNELSFLMLKAQKHLGLPQPNLSARLFSGSSESFIDACSRVIGLGSGMPQVFNDESVIPALEKSGIDHREAVNYSVVGCVELSTHGNTLGWSDAAMFNMVKVLELTLTNGTCLLTGRKIGPETGNLSDFKTFEDFEKAFACQIDFFIEKMVPVCDTVDRLHAQMLPSPFLSGVVDDCLDKGKDVTAGGARYNLSGIQAIQAANIADSLAVVKRMLFDTRELPAEELLQALKTDFEGYEPLRRKLFYEVPKYGNDIAEVDRLGNQWIDYFAGRLKHYTNARGGPYHTGLYTVSAHVPMGKNVGATPDGRRAGKPLADGGLSPVCGRDISGPTAVLKSVSKIDSINAGNGTLLNMKFLPDIFTNRATRQKFNALLRGFVRLLIHHVQFNVIGPETLRDAKRNPEQYRFLTVRVAGYTAFFTDLAEELQDEIIARTTHALGRG